MKRVPALFFRLVLLAFIFIFWWWGLNATLSNAINLYVISVGVLLTYPVVWLGRKMLDRGQTAVIAEWTITFVHSSLAFTFGLPIIRAIITHQDWPGWVIPLPKEVGLALVIITGASFLLTVLNLALKGFGAPFFIALSRKLAADWMYAWTRNPMVLAALAFLISLGLWYQSILFILWVLLFFTPALLFFIKVFEERELEIRFGKSYLEYKTRTPMLIPGKPKK